MAYVQVMRIGYGIGRARADFDGAKVDQLYLDGSSTERSERQLVFSMGLRPGEGDTLVLVSRGDLAKGAALRQLEKRVADLGAAIEIYDPPRPRSRPGPKPDWEPNPEDDARFSRLWRDIEVDGPHVIRLACQAADWAETPENIKRMRYRLTRRYGPRTQN